MVGGQRNPGSGGTARAAHFPAKQIVAGRADVAGRDDVVPSECPLDRQVPLGDGGQAQIGQERVTEFRRKRHGFTGVAGQAEGTAVNGIGGDAHARVVIQAAAGAQRGLAVSGETPGETQARRKVPVGGRPQRRDPRAALRGESRKRHHLSGGRVPKLGGRIGDRRGTEFPAQARGQRKPRGDAPGILNPQRQLRHAGRFVHRRALGDPQILLGR